MQLRILLFCVALTAALVPVTPAGAGPTDRAERRVEPVVLTGAQLPQWSRAPAEGVARPYPGGALDDVRDAHHGTLIVPPDARAGAAIDRMAGYRWNGKRFIEIPIQIDERFPYFLANARSDFGLYSGTDKELTYEWDVESWKKTAGECYARYPDVDETLMKGFPTEDPVSTFDDDDELVFMASDAGARAPAEAPPPHKSDPGRLEVRLTDPLDPTAERFVYLVTKKGGSGFDASEGYVDYRRDADADQWIDRSFFDRLDPEKLGTSNTGYGPNLTGTVCHDGVTPVPSTDRFPRDGITVSTDTYRFHASGRWMLRDMRVTKPGTARDYGPDLIDRWKGRAFQSSPDSTISLVGFEDEQVNWEANSALIGERTGLVRAIREVWGADSGTNTTKVEYFYRDTIATKYHLRVHPIPPDGLYTAWDHNHGTAATYYNETRSAGVPIDGRNDDIGNVDEIGGRPAYFDAPDPTFTKPQAILNWDQVSGRNDFGSLVYITELKNPQGAENPTVVPYYRDDACFDDGTGDDPSPRVLPGDSFDSTTEEYRQRPCFGDAPEGYDGLYRQGAFGSHGVHFFFVNDTDNAWAPIPTTELVAQETQFAVPTASPKNVGDAYANTIKASLVAMVTPRD